MMKYQWPKATWGPTGYFQLRVQHHSVYQRESWQELKQSKNSRQELWPRPWRNATCWLAPHGLLRLLFFFFLIAPRTTISGMTPPHNELGPPSHKSRKCTISLPTGQTSWDIFSIEAPCSKRTVSCGRLT